MTPRRTVRYNTQMDTQAQAIQVPVFIDSVNGHFVVRLATRPDLQAEAATREGALEALRDVVHGHFGTGNLAFKPIEPKGPQAWAGVFKDDPTLDDICREAYRQRDELRKQEFGE
jgi:hypothetical protein